MRTLSDTNVYGNTYALQLGGTINIYVNGGNTVGGKYNSTPSLLAVNTNFTPVNAGYYQISNSGYSTNSVSFAVLPIQIWNDSNTVTRRSWLYLKGPYSNSSSLSFNTSGKILYSDIRTFDSDPETLGYYGTATISYSPSKQSIYNQNNITYDPPSQELFITVFNGTSSPTDVRAPVSYNGSATTSNSSVIKTTSTVTGSFNITVLNDAMLLNGAKTFTPSPNNYTKQVDFTGGSTIVNATVIPRKQQTWIIG